MRILICTDTFYPGIGGTEAACFGFASELVAEGHEVLLACPDYHREDARQYSFPVLRLPALSLTDSEVMVYVSRSKKAMKQMEAFRPDAIHLQSWSGMARIALKLGKKLGVPVVMTMHTQLRLLYRRTLKLPVLIRAFIGDAVRKMRRADLVTTVAGCMRAELAACGYEKSAEIPVIRNGAMAIRSIVTEEERREARVRFGLHTEKPVLIFVGHIAQFKRVDFLLRALRIAVDGGFDGSLMLVGSGVDEKRYQRLSRKLGLSDRVLFTGRLERREDVKTAYAAADLFVMASIFDNDPIVVVEAACRGLPALTIENTGSSERLTDGVDGFVAPSDEAAFAKRIIELFAEPRILREVGIRAADRIPTQWADTVAAYLPLYEKLIEEKAKSRRGET